MEKQTTYAAIILDRSGSMWRTKAATVRGYNEQVQQIKEDSQDENHDIFVSLLTFNGSVVEHLWAVPADQLEEATEEDFLPKGSTAMRDAVGHTIQKFLDTTDSDDPNTAYLITVITDGEENASKHFNVHALRELTESVQNSDKWTINYMGCNKVYLERVAQETNVPVANCAVWANDTVANTEFAFKESRGKLGGYFKSRASGQTASKNFHNLTADDCDCYIPTRPKTDDKPDVVDHRFNPPSKQELFKDAMQNFGVADVQVPDSTDPHIKPLTNNVFGTGNRVDPEVWARYEASGTTKTS